jgi:uncharacterized protein YycO
MISNNSCQTEIPQANQEATTKEISFFTQFMITGEKQEILAYEAEFIENIENIKREHFQKNIIAEYIADTKEQQLFLSSGKETQFYELSTEEKVNILDSSNGNKTYRFGDDLMTMNRRKMYRFGEFQLALCGAYF